MTFKPANLEEEERTRPNPVVSFQESYYILVSEGVQNSAYRKIGADARWILYYGSWVESISVRLYSNGAQCPVLSKTSPKGNF